MRTTSYGKRIVSVGLTVCLLICGMSGCEEKDTSPVEQRVMDFTAKCNELDLDGILRCLDPALSEPIAWMFELAEIGGIEKEEILSAVYTMMTDESGLDEMDFFESIDVKIEEVRMGSKNATVIADVSYVVADIPFNKDGEIYLIKETDTWYISGLGLEE